MHFLARGALYLLSCTTFSEMNQEEFLFSAVGSFFGGLATMGSRGVTFLLVVDFVVRLYFM